MAVFYALFYLYAIALGNPVNSFSQTGNLPGAGILMINALASCLVDLNSRNLESSSSGLCILVSNGCLNLLHTGLNLRLD